MRKRFYFTVFLTGITFVSFAQNTCQKAQTAFANGEYDKAISYYNVCKRDFGNDVSKEIDNAKKCRDLLVVANNYFDTKDYENAAKNYTAVLDINAKDPRAKSRKNEILIITGKQYIRYDNGYYFGVIKDGNRNGYGKYCWNDGDVYEGDWAYGKRHGHGTVRIDGEVYEGEWKDDKRVGKLTHHLANGSVEIGTFTNGIFVSEQASAKQTFAKPKPEKEHSWFGGYVFSLTSPVGFMAGVCGSRFGGYASIKTAMWLTSSDKTKFILATDADSDIYDINYDDYKHYRWAVSAGGIVHTFGNCYLYAGLGYGEYGKACTAKHSYDSNSKYYYIPEKKGGLDIECGLMYKFKGFYLSAGYNMLTVSKTIHDFSVGIGLGF